jgi:hypothetical protein
MPARRHGDCGSPEYHAWEAMLQRCNNRRHPRYPLYGGRGIKVCVRWLIYEHFLADMGRKPTAKHSLERRDNDAGYGPQNCAWATQSAQLRNTRVTHFVSIGGKRMSVTEAAQRLGVAHSTVRYREKKGLLA